MVESRLFPAGIALEQGVTMWMRNTRCAFALLAAIAGLALPQARADDASQARAWWAIQPLVRPPVPRTSHGLLVTNPIDAFIHAKLAGKKLTPAPEADLRTFVRRLCFNLTGLPPTPEEVSAFTRECESAIGNSHSAIERLADRLLASPRHGERWARHWMDAAHFAETHGHDQDRIRTNAWPYRDYLIASFNADKPYARFVEEQVAGDALFPDDPQAVVALGFLAAGPWDESSLRDIREDTLDRQIGRYLDRDDIVTTVMQTFTSTTVQCARCHDHKFDPITQGDYYSLQAVFAGTDKGNRRYDTDPAVHRRRRELKSQLAAVERNDRNLLPNAASQRAVADWEQIIGGRPAEWRTLDAETFVSAAGATLTRQPDGSLLASGQHGPTDVYTITAGAPLRALTAVRLELLPDDSLPQRGPGRESNGNLHLSEFQLLVFERGANAARRIELKNPTADFNQSGWTIAQALDGNDKSAWGIYPRVGQPHAAVFELAEPLRTPAGSTLTFVLKQLHGGHCLGRFRLSLTDADPPTRAAILPEPIRAALDKPFAQRTDDDRAALAAFVLRRTITEELAKLPLPSLAYVGGNEFEPDGSHKPAAAPRPVHVLHRGEITKPREAARFGALACLTGMPANFELNHPSGDGARRAALARWLTHRDNPLTWRSIVNRVWHHHFGRGLVDTPNDFGRMGGAPSHPELLDWLAVWFRDDARGSLKQLHRLIVTSGTYRQSSRIDDLRFTNDASSSDSRVNRKSQTVNQEDPDNRFHAKMNRTRLDAEQVRDAILQISGRLDLRMGGPSDMQFDLQPGIHVTPRVDYAKFDVDGPAGRRRGVYRFLFRTLPDPWMEALDCPAGDQLAPARNNTVTVQQALALWNDAFVTRHAEHFAARLEREAAGIDAQIILAFQLALSRPPTDSERRDFAAYAAKHGLANFCRLLFNANEFMFVN
jgi:hypothetical protein